jgi:LAGLIDADG endonuclease
LRVLYYIKKKLGYGSVHVESKNTIADFRIRDRDILKKVLFPIFDEYPLLTNKYFNYMKFKKAYEILTNIHISNEERDFILTKLKDLEIPKDYVSPA